MKPNATLPSNPSMNNKRGGGGGPIPRTSGQASGAESSLSDADTQAKWPHDKYDEIQ